MLISRVGVTGRRNAPTFFQPAVVKGSWSQSNKNAMELTTKALAQAETKYGKYSLLRCSSCAATIKIPWRSVLERCGKRTDLFVFPLQLICRRCKVHFEREKNKCS
jgi:hypothetical protein